MEYCSITTNMPTVLFMNLTISEVLMAASVIVMVIATIFAYTAAKATRDNTKTLLFKDIFKEYSTNQMRKDLMLLVEWRKNNESQLKGKIKSFGDDRKKLDDNKIQSVDEARRRVKHYFTDSIIFCKEGKMKEKLVPIFELSGVEILFKVVEHLDKAIVKDDPVKLKIVSKTFDEMFKYVKVGKDLFKLEKYRKDNSHLSNFN